MVCVCHHRQTHVKKPTRSTFLMCWSLGVDVETHPSYYGECAQCGHTLIHGVAKPAELPVALHPKPTFRAFASLVATILVPMIDHIQCSQQCMRHLLT